MPPKLDRETKKQLEQGQAAESLASSSQWKGIRSNILKRIARLDSITSIPANMPVSDRVVEYGARQYAIQELLSVIAEVEGEAMKSLNLREQLAEIREEDNIITFYNGSSEA